MGSEGFVEFNLNLNLKLFYRPDSSINIPKDLSEIDKFCVQLMSMNDHLLHYRQELSKIHYLQHQSPDSMIILLQAIEKFEDEFLKLKENPNLKSNERFIMDFSSAKRTGREAMDIDNNNNINNNNGSQAKNNEFPVNQKSDLTKTEGLLNLDKEESETIEPVAVVHKRPGKEVMGEGTHKEKPVTMEPVVAVHKQSGKEVGSSSGSGSGDGRALDVKPLRVLLNRTKNPAGIRKRRSNKRMTWTPRLHRKFIKAIKILGGPQVAKANPIINLMNVRGLTNQHVRSHLQKYRKELEELAAVKGKAKLEEENKDLESVAECGGPRPFYLHGYKYLPVKLVPKPKPKPKLNNNNNNHHHEIIIINDDDAE